MRLGWLVVASIVFSGCGKTVGDGHANTVGCTGDKSHFPR